MPDNSHLKWVEVTDFSGGLYTANSGFLTPAGKFQQMQDCYPHPGGGLRAFFKPTAIVTTGIASLTTERLIAIHTQLLADLSESMLLMTQVVSTGAIKMYYKSSGASSWTLTKSFGAPASAAVGVGSIGHYDAAGVYYFVVNVPYLSGSDQGIWTFNPASNTWAQIKTAVAGPVVNYQGRIVAGNLTQLIWTDPGGLTFPAANFLNLYQGSTDFRSAVASLVPYAPSTLLVATSQDHWFSIDGAIDDPVARMMGSTALPQISQTMAADDDGAIFFAPGRGVYLSHNMSSSFDRIDPDLAPTAFPSPAASAFPFPSHAATGGFLWAPGGIIMDKLSKAWFSISQHASATPIYSFWQREDSEVLALQYGSGGVIYDFVTSESGSRAESMVVQTAPIRADSGRQVAVREVQVGVNSLSAEATVTVTVGGTTSVSSALGVGKNVVSFLFAERGEYLDITFTLASNHSGVEAPMFEFFRVGARPDAHQIHY